MILNKGKIYIILFLSAVVFCPSTQPLEANYSSRVLLISSYHPGFPTYYNQIDGIESVLPDDILLDCEFMDSKRFSDKTNTDYFKKYLSYKLNKLQPYDLIITADDNALHFVEDNKRSLFKGIPVIFMGVNDIEYGLRISKNRSVQGILEEISVFDNIALMKGLFPNRKNIIIITDKTRTSNADYNEFLKVKKKFPDCNFIDLSLRNYSFHEVYNKLSEYEDYSILIISLYRDKNDHILIFQDSLKKIIEHAKGPVFHIYEHGLGNGIFGGKMVSHFNQGKVAGFMAVKVLKGNELKTIHGNERINRYCFDYDVMKKYHIVEEMLPDNSEIINLPNHKESVNILYFLGSIIIIIIQIIIIIYLITSIKYRKKANMAYQKSIREKEALLHEIHYRVMNNLQIINSILFLQGENRENSEKCEMCQNRIMSMSLVHDQLYSTEDFGKIFLDEYYGKYIKMIENQFSEMNVSVNLDLAHVKIHSDKLIVLSLLVNEIVVNSYQHAFTDTIDKTITLKAGQTTNKIIFVVSDNGSGFDDVTLNKKTLGSKIIKMLVKQLKAEIHLDRENGTSYIIIIPKE